MLYFDFIIENIMIFLFDFIMKIFHLYIITHTRVYILDIYDCIMSM